MNNPNYPHLNRKIRHAKILREAGFELDSYWHNSNHQAPVGMKPNGAYNLIYWKRGKIRVTLFDYQQISLKDLIKRIEENIKYNLKRDAEVVFPD